MLSPSPAQPEAGKFRIALFAFVFLLSFVFIRVYNNNPVFLLLNAADEGGYFSYTQVAFVTQTFDWCDPRFENTDYDQSCRPPEGSAPSRPNNISTPGTALLLLPFTGLGFSLQKIGLLPFGSLNEALRFWSVIGTFFLFLGGLLCQFELGLRWGLAPWKSFAATALFALGSVVLYYVFRRPLMAHAAEFFLLSALVFLLFSASVSRGGGRLFLIGLTTAMLLITRINVGPALGAAFVIALAQDWRGWLSLAKKALPLALGALPPLFVFLLVQYFQRGSFAYSPGSYDPDSFGASGLVSQLSPLVSVNADSFRRYFDFLWGSHWGFFWIMPILWLELAYLLRGGPWWRELWSKHRYASLLCLVFFFLQVNLLANYPSNGMAYGLRYLLVPVYCFHVLFLYALAKADRPLRRPALWVSLATLLALVGGFHVLNFESNASTLTLTPQRQELEGIYHPDWKDKVRLAAPDYAFHSLRYTFSGTAIRNLVASPAAAYSLFGLEAVAGEKMPFLQTALAYYKSPKRGIYQWQDLGLLVRYQLVFLLLLGVFCFGYLRWMRST